MTWSVFTCCSTAGPNPAPGTRFASSRSPGASGTSRSSTRLSLSPDFLLSGPLKARSWKAVDITSLAAELSEEENYISLALTTRSRNALELASRESGLHGPRLVVEREGSSEGPTTESTTTGGDFSG